MKKLIELYRNDRKEFWDTVGGGFSVILVLLCLFTFLS